MISIFKHGGHVSIRADRDLYNHVKSFRSCFPELDVQIGMYGRKEEQIFYYSIRSDKIELAWLYVLVLEHMDIKQVYDHDNS